MTHWIRNTIDWVDHHLAWLLIINGLCLHFLVFHNGAFPPPIRADGIDYYIYLPSLLLHGDPTLEEAIEAGAPHISMARDPATGRWQNRYNVGVAVMLLPAFVAAHLLTWVMRPPPGAWDWFAFQHPLDGYSFFYQHAAGIWGMLAMTAGLLLLRAYLRRSFSRRISLLTILVLYGGTNLLAYATFETVLTHGYLFLLFAAFLFLTEQWYADPANRRVAFALGVVVGAALLVRTMAGILVVPWLLYRVTSWRDLGSRVRTLLQAWPSLLIMSAGAFLLFLPQMAIWKISFDSWLTNSYGDLGLPYLTEPRLLEVLFSVQKGLFTYCPVLLVALPGFVLLWKKRSPWCLGAAGFLFLQAYLAASAAVWYAGGSFGHRYFIEAYVFAAFPVAAFYEAVNRRPTRWWFWGPFTVLTSLWMLFFMKLYLTHELPVEGLDAAAFRDIFWWRWQWIKGSVP